MPPKHTLAVAFSLVLTTQFPPVTPTAYPLSFFFPYLKPQPNPPHKLELCTFWLLRKFCLLTHIQKMDLESVRDSLIRQEDTIVFSLIERAKFPINSWAYSPPQNGVDAFSASSFLHSFVRESETLHAKVPLSHLVFSLSFCLIFPLTLSILF